MKKVMYIVLAVIGLVGSASAQTWVNNGSTGNGLTELWSITAWSPFASDSTGIQNSDALNISGVDSLYVWNSAISANGTANLVGAFQAGFSPTYSSTTHDSLAPVIDTTRAKLETMRYYGVIYPKGAPWAIFRFNPKTGGTGAGNFYTLRKDAILNIYVRLFYGKQTTAR